MGAKGGRKTGQRIVLAVIGVLGLAAGVILWLWSTDTQAWKQYQRFMEGTSVEQRSELAESLEMRLMTQLTATQAPSSSGGSGGEQAGGFAGMGGGRPVGQRASIVPGLNGPGGGMATPGQRAAGEANEAADGPADGIDGTPRQITITVDEANAWLTTRLGELLAHRGVSLPDEISQPGVAIEDERFVALFRFESEDISQNVSMIFDAEMTDEGGESERDLRFRLHSVKGGRLPLPFDMLVDHFRARGQEKAKASLEKVAWALEGEPLEPTFDLDGKRQVRLLDFDLSGDEFVLTVRTEARKD
jgi:hypothetical protein